MPDTYSIAIFDRVRVRVAPETEAAGIAASVGQVYKVVRLSATGAKVIGQCNDDVAVSVHFDTRKETLWLAPELLEIVRSDRKAEAPIQWVRSENGKWLEILMPRKSPWWKFWSRKDVAVTTGNDKMVAINVLVPREMREALQREMAARKWTLAIAIRDAIEQWLKTASPKSSAPRRRPQPR